jgi:uncharacterized repeat protein (TIGR03803 family)
MTTTKNILTRGRFSGFIHAGECESGGASSRLPVCDVSPVQEMMLNRFGRPLACHIVCFVLLLGQGLPAAVTFTNTPSAVSNQYTGTISLQITGLTNSETVVVQKFLDANTNGVVDAGDLLVQQFQLTDNQGATVIAGVTNIVIPYDSNPAASNITATFNLAVGGVEQEFVGQFAFVVSSPTSRFPAMTNLFSVTNSPYGQSFTGQILATNGAPVPNAIVMLGRPGNGLNLQAGVAANNSGAFRLKAAAGAYKLMAFKNDFITDIGNAPIVTLATNATVSTNLTLLPANLIISGKLADATNASLGIPGIFMAAKSTNNLYGLSTTDTNGNFTLPAASSPGQWGFGEEQLSLATHGYVGLNNQTNVITSTGSVAGVTIAFPEATALFYGVVTNGQGTPLPGVSLSGRNSNGNNGDGPYQGQATSDQNGNYVIGVVATNWDVEVETGNNGPKYANYIFSQTPWRFDNGGNGTNIVTATAVRADFAGLLGTNQISGSLTTGSGAPIANVQINVNGQIAGIGANYQANSATTDTNGHYVIYVVNGTWNVNPNCCACCNDANSLPPIYLCPDNQTVIILNNNGVADFIAMPATPDVASYSLSKQQNFVQTGPTAVVADTNAPFQARFHINESSPGSVLSASVTLPGGATQAFPGSSDTDLSIKSNFTTQAALDTTFPSGSYTFTIFPQHDCNRSVALSLPITAFPIVPQITNFSAAQAIASGSNFVLRWSAFTGGTANDVISLEIDDTNGNSAFFTPDYLTPGWVNGTNTAITIPSGKLLPGQMYLGRLSFIKIASLDTNSYPGAWGADGFSSQTTFALGTATNAPVPLTLSTIYQFSAGEDGANPNAALVQASDGNLYGTTVGGGALGWGVIFKLFTNATLANLYSFTNGDDGANPEAPLVQGSNGVLYSTAFAGGAGGAGTIFKITTNAAFTLLYPFGGGSDGGFPVSALSLASNAVFYGTTLGASGGGVGNGTVFKLTTNGVFSTIYSFSGGNDGDDPEAALALGRDGNFYGTSRFGGTSSNGTVFRVTTNGGLTTLHSFTSSDGSEPVAGLLRSADGNFYGTTSAGGSAGLGTVFKMTTNGTLTTLHSFNGANDGSNPSASVVQGSDGNLYGTTASGGPHGDGTVFTISTNGAFTNLYSFSGPDGSTPYSALVQASDGSFYGTTSAGGPADAGTIFRFSLTSVSPPDLAPVSVTAPATVLSISPNPFIIVSWAVTNQGAGSARAGWWDRVWISTNGVLDRRSMDAGDFFISPGTIGTLSLPAGGSYHQTNIIVLPVTNSGNFTVFVQVDVFNQIYESNKVNNTSAGVTGTFLLQPADLAPVYFVAPAQVASNQPNPAITVAWGVTNQGIGAASGGWLDTVWFSTNGVLDAQSIDAGDFFITNNVPAGSSYYQTNSITLPMSASGNYTLFLQVDSADDLFESNETNNTSLGVPGTFILTYDSLALQIGSTVLRAGQKGVVPLLQAGNGVAGMTLSLGYPSDRVTSLQLTNLGTDICAAILAQASNSLAVSLQTCDGQPLAGSVRLADLAFTTASNQSSAFAPLTGSVLLATNAQGATVTRQSLMPGRVVIIGPQPLLESFLATNSQRGLNLYGKPGSSYQLESTTNISDASSWKPAWRVPLTNFFLSFQPIDPSQPRLFFRGYEFFASPPILEISSFTNRSISLLLYAKPGSANTVLSTTNLSNPITWTTQQNLSLTNSFQFLNPIPATNSTMFFRALSK